MKHKQQYLVLVQRNPHLPPSEQEVQDVSQVTKWMDQQVKEGNLEQWGLFGVYRGGYGVWNVGSMDELHVILGGAPFHMYADYQIYPLVSVEAFNKNLKQILAHVTQKVPAGAHR